MRGLSLELAVLDGPLLERPYARDAVVRLPENALPQRPTATSSRAVPTNAISSFVRTLAGRRATPLTNGSPIRRRPSRATRESRSSAKIAQTSKTVEPPTMFVISHFPSIRATSKSAVVAYTTSPVSISM